MKSKDDVLKMERAIKQMIDDYYLQYLREKAKGNTIKADVIWDKLCIYNQSISVLRWVLDSNSGGSLSSYLEDLHY